MFARMGVPNGQMALFTSLLYLPWTFKFLWSPFVDIIKTKRWWIVAMQAFMSAAFIILTLTLPHPAADSVAAGTTPMSLFTFTLIMFVFAAFASATHDISADGFYMLALSQKNQSAFVGIRSTFYRLANVFGNGVIVAVAGILENKTGNIPLAWQLTLAGSSVLLTLLTVYHAFAIPKADADVSHIGEDTGNKARAIISEFGRTVTTYFKKPGVLLAICFMLLYRLPEAFSINIPVALTSEMEAHASDRQACYQIGQEWCAEQCRDLLRHDVPAVHFYTMGKAANIVGILRENF